MYKYPCTIAGAAKILDEAKPGWENEIDLDILDIGNCFKCILGQLFFGGYDAGLNKLFNIERKDYFYYTDDIFGSSASQKSWIEEILSRRNK